MRDTMVNSLFDRNRKKQIQQDLAKGRLDLSRRGKGGGDAFEEAETKKIPAQVMEEKISADAPVIVPQPGQQPLLPSPPRPLTDPYPTRIFLPAQEPVPDLTPWAPQSPPLGPEQNSPEYTRMVQLPESQGAGKPAKTAYFGLEPNRSVKGKILGKGPNASPFAGMAHMVEGPAINPQDALDYALFDAIRSRDYIAVEAAIMRGANVNASKMVSLTPNAGPGDRHMWAPQTPLDVANCEGDGGIVHLLKKYGAKE